MMSHDIPFADSTTGAVKSKAFVNYITLDFTDIIIDYIASLSKQQTILTNKQL